MSKLKILACQIDIPPIVSTTDRAQHLKNTASKVNLWLKENPADILLLPELSTLDYSNQTFANLDELAEDDNGASFDTWAKVAGSNHCWVLYGYARRNHQQNGFSIATGIVSPQGTLYGVYEKMHLAHFGASEEKDYFSVSGKKLITFDCNGFTLSPIICYDIRFPELIRTLVLKHKVDCILHTGAYARDASFASWHAFAKTRAMESQVYFVSLNRAGANFGQSVFMPPWVDAEHPSVQFEDTAEHCQLLTLRQEAIDRARQQFQFLGDRLPNYDLPVATAARKNLNLD